MIMITPYTFLLIAMASLLDVFLTLFILVQIFKALHETKEQALRNLMRLAESPFVFAENLLMRNEEQYYPRWVIWGILSCFYLLTRFALHYLLASVTQ
ncbi:MAG: hypothetical protein COA73_12110 [Candidatus Hydrogenedentota bacterium]|nr:MAG: hypothetical protein COA73_12110 [Candidatus Hydrogenedentota bacterium]